MGKSVMGGSLGVEIVSCNSTIPVDYFSYMYVYFHSN